MPIGTGYDDQEHITIAKPSGPSPNEALRKMDFDTSGVIPEKVHNVKSLGQIPESVHNADELDPGNVTNVRNPLMKG